MITENRVAEKIVLGIHNRRINFICEQFSLTKRFWKAFTNFACNPFRRGGKLQAVRQRWMMDARKQVVKHWGTHDGKQKDMFTPCFIQCENTTHTCPGHSTDTQPVCSHLTPSPVDLTLTRHREHSVLRHGSFSACSRWLKIEICSVPKNSQPPYIVHTFTQTMVAERRSTFNNV